MASNSVPVRTKRFVEQISGYDDYTVEGMEIDRVDWETVTVDEVEVDDETGTFTATGTVLVVIPVLTSGDTHVVKRRSASVEISIVEEGPNSLAIEEVSVFAV